jgi:AraC-like DNA-binding protein
MLNNLNVRAFMAETLRIAPGSWNTKDVKSSYWRFYWNQEDGAGLILESGYYRLHPHRIYFIPAGVPFSCDIESEVNHFYIHFDLLGIDSAAIAEIFNAPVCVASSRALHEDVQALVSAYEVLESGISLWLECRTKGIIYAALAEYLKSLTCENLARFSTRSAEIGLVKNAIDYIRNHMSEELTNAKLAGLCELSEPYFISQFHRRVGVPPAQYIRNQRITAASQMLLFTDHGIEEIAERNGFSSRSYFSRVFLQITGTSPAAYRKAPKV